MTAAESDLVHQLRAARAELGDVQSALDSRAATLEEQALAEYAGDLTKAGAIAAELAHSAFWFRAFHEKARQCRVLRAEVAALKELRRG